MTLIPQLRDQIREMFPPAPLRMPLSKELWEGQDFSVYLRNSSKTVDGKRYHAIVVARVDLSPALEGRGYFRELCTAVEALAEKHPFIQVISHECVLNPKVAAMLLRHGYREIPHLDEGISSDFIKWAKSSPISLEMQNSAHNPAAAI